MIYNAGILAHLCICGVFTIDSNIQFTFVIYEDSSFIPVIDYENFSFLFIA
jgi:hypothetical protein